MNQWSRGIFATFLLLAFAGTADSDALTYKQEFVEEVTRFASLNRLNISRLHRDIHANCYIPVTIAAVISSDGSLKGVSIAKSSTVPVVDRYFLYVIEQAAPFQPLAKHYQPVPEEITITQELRLDAQLWDNGVRSTRSCAELKPQSPGAD